MYVYRPKGYQEVERRHKKDIAKVDWYRPSNSVRNIAEEEGKVKGLKVKIVERVGIQIKSRLPGLLEMSGEGSQPDKDGNIRMITSRKINIRSNYYA